MTSVLKERGPVSQRTAALLRVVKQPDRPHAVYEMTGRYRSI